MPARSEYGSEFQARADEELVRLPEGSAIVEILCNCAVMREQAQAQ